MLFRSGSIQGLDNSGVGIGISSGNFSFGNYAYIVGTQNTFRVKSSIALGFSTDTFNAANDVAISRISAGVIGVGTGAQGNASGKLQAAQFISNGGALTSSVPGLDITQEWNNGSSGFTALRVNATTTTANYALELFDIVGKKLMEKQLGTLNTDNQQIQLSTNQLNLPSGSYLISLTQNGERKSCKVFVVN